MTEQTKYQIKYLAPNYWLRAYDEKEDEWNCVSCIFKFEKINGRLVLEMTEDELINDYLAGGKKWSLR